MWMCGVGKRMQVSLAVPCQSWMRDQVSQSYPGLQVHSLRHQSHHSNQCNVNHPPGHQSLAATSIVISLFLSNYVTQRTVSDTSECYWYPNKYRHFPTLVKHIIAPYKQTFAMQSKFVYAKNRVNQNLTVLNRPQHE